MSSININKIANGFRVWCDVGRESAVRHFAKRARQCVSPFWLLTPFLLNDLDCSENGDLETVAAAKIQEITADLEKIGSESFDPVERIKSGFVRFKTEKYEYVLFLRTWKLPWNMLLILLL